MNKIIIYLFLFFSFSSSVQSFGQTSYTDSLEVLLHTVYKDSLVKQCRIYLDLFQQYKQTNTVKSKLYLQKALSIPNQINDEKTKLKALLIISIHNLTYKELDHIVPYSIQALKIANDVNDVNGVAKAYYAIGGFYLYREEHKKALDFLTLSLQMANRAKNENLKAYIASCFGTIYSTQHQYDSAYVYFNKALIYFEKNNDKQALMGQYINISGVLHNQGEYTKAHSYFQKALNIAKEQNNTFAELMILFNISNSYEIEKETEAAKYYANELLAKAEKINSYDHIIGAKQILSLINSKQQHYEAAITEAKEALELANKTKIRSNDVISLYDILVSSYKHKNDYAQAYKYLQLQSQLKDSVTRTENSNYIEEIKHKYNLQQKNQELALKTELLKEIETSDRQKTIIIISLLTLFISGAISIFLFRQRRKIKEELVRKNADLEHQNKNFEAFINGQEQERKRIASDLHDGLAQNLVMLKMGVSNIPIEDGEQQKKLNYYTNEIDRMIEETRKISHNMMPGVLVDLGLLKALKSLINDINTNHPTLSIKLSATAFSATLSSETEIQLYRVIQELLNNIIKHSQATSCTIKLASTPSVIEIRVNDNGAGFEKNHEKKGIGLQNIYSRIHSIHGTLLIDSAPTKGTTVTITIPIT